MQEELLKQMNQKLAKLVIEISTLVQFMTTSGAGAGATSMPERQDFDDEFEAAKGSPIPGVASAVMTPDVELDANGIPWDQRIHAKTKTQTVKGVWKRAKGIDDKLFDSVMAELTNAEVATPAAGTTPPPPPGVKAATPPPPPGVSSAENADKKKAMSMIAILTDEFGVDYGLILAALSEAFMVKSFDELKVEQYLSAGNLFERWVDGVRECDEEVEFIMELGQKTNQVPATEAGVTQTLTNNKVSKLAELRYDQVSTVLAELKDYHEQWEAYAKSIA
jgi:hypothetical protein